MSSVTKNPQILMSASFVYNWFLSLDSKNEKFLNNNGLLNQIKSDENVVENLDRNFSTEKERINIEKRYEELSKKIIGELNE